jgi:glycosyltransferase involved in cell wall biosynthesis
LLNRLTYNAASIMMRLALITPGFSKHGADWAIPALQSLVLELAQTISPVVFSLRYPQYGRYQFGSVTHYAAGGGTRFGWRSLVIWQHTLRSIIVEHRRRPFDVLHAFWADEAGFTAVLAAKLIRRPVIVTVAGGELVHLPDIGYGTQASPFRRRIIRAALAGANLVTAGSPYQLDMVRQHQVSEAKARLAPLGVDCRRFQPPVGANRRPVAVQAASLVPVKNQSLLLECFHLARQQAPELRLLVAGDGLLAESLRRQAEAMGVAHALTWAGRLPHLEMAPFYGQGSVYLQSSRHEAQGMAVLEAMACGLPALGTPVGSLCEVAARPAQWEPAVLAGQLVELLRDPAVYRIATSLAREQITEQFSLPAAASRFLELYQELADTGRC